MATTQVPGNGKQSGTTPPPSAQREQLASHDPATGEVVGTVPVMTADDVDAAVARARTAAATWSAMSYGEREAELARFRAGLAEACDDLAEVIARENGKPRVDAMTEVYMALSHLSHAARRAEKALKSHRVSPGLLANYRATISYHPLGVVGVIGPWNYPIFTPMGSIAYALAAGNTVVFKPSELTPLTGVKIAEIAARTLSIPDVFQVVTGAGATGAALARAAVDKIAFTGSAGTGKKVMQAAAERLTPVLMELGGKDPMIVTDDADVDKAAEAAVFGALTNSGQACISVERVYVHEAVYDRFVAKVVDEVRAVKVGGDDGNIGAMTSPAQVDIVRDHLTDAVARGAKVLAGGPDAISGNFIQPTVLVDVTADMKVMKDETFGPVIPIVKVASTEDAVRAANETTFGLGSSVFAGKKAKDIADRIRAGMTAVNSVMAFSAITSLPFGGVGESGFGRIHGDEGIREFTRTKATAEESFALPVNLLSFKLPKGTYERIRGLIKQLYGDGAVARAQDFLRRVF
ncbi:MAG: aldehyde dehydrogenase family protein [Kofleriaceae bacterium]|nr:aldehyde dehydrogenase family protein [Myxococcales bacterium]MCB9559982.1 aldehyde dehydrogenase family protein [Kofleriaceae bacterium]MCB9575159.1 aldehyde dehydrogenase family protein [Kofleriaceae bacterium]